MGREPPGTPGGRYWPDSRPSVNAFYASAKPRQRRLQLPACPLCCFRVAAWRWSAVAAEPGFVGWPVPRLIRQAHAQPDTFAQLVDFHHLHPHNVTGLDHITGSLTKRSARAEIWTRPSWCTPISTKAPEGRHVGNGTFMIMSGARSEIFPRLPEGAPFLNSGLGSRPGLASSAMISFTVGRPTFHCCKPPDPVRAGRKCHRSCCRPHAAGVPRLRQPPAGIQGGPLRHPGGWPRPIIRRKPAACSNVFRRNGDL